MTPPESETLQQRPAESSTASASERPTGEVADRLARQTERDGQAALDVAARRAREMEDERPPGFARLAEPTEEEEFLESLSVEDKLALLEEFFKAQQEKPPTPKQKLSMLKLAFLETLADQMVNNRMTSSLRLIGESIGKTYRLREWIKNNRDRLTAHIVANENFDLSSEEGFPPEMQKIIERFGGGVRISELRTEQDIYNQYGRIIQALRSAGAYDEAESLMEDILKPELAAGRKKLGEKWKDKIKAEADRKVFRLYMDNQEAWRAAFREQFSREYRRWHNAPRDAGPAPDTSEARVESSVQAYYESMRQIAHEHALNQRVAGYILGKKVKVPGVKQAICDQYVEMLDPRHEWLNLRDEQWDTIIEEVAINLPLILASGGVASLARRGLSEVTYRFLVREGAKLCGKKLAEDTLISRVISGTARAGIGMMIEGATFDMTHRVLTGEMYQSLPDWGRSVLLSSVTLGIFHGTGRLSERLFTKTVGGLPYNTWLGEKIGGNITNRTVREAVRTLAGKGHIGAATMLTISATQHAAYNGSLDEFWKNIGDEILHAYITDLGLKLQGGMLQRARALRARRTNAPDELAARARQERGEIDAEAIEARLRSPRVKSAEKRRIRKALKEGHPELLIEIEAEALIRQKIENTPQEKALSEDAKLALIKKESLLFANELLRLQRIGANEALIENLMDFEARFSEKDGTDISTWEARRQYADRLFREIQTERLTDKMIKAYYMCERKVKALPKEKPGIGDKKQVLRRIQAELSAEERLLPLADQRALVRSRFYQTMGELSKLAGTVMDRMEQFARQHPEATAEEIIHEAMQHGFDVLPGEARRKMRIAALRFERNRQVMRLATETFTPAELFEKVFGAEPYESVAIDTRSPFALRFVLDPIDYLRVAKDELLLAPPEQLHTLLETQGVGSSGCKKGGAGALPELAGLITAVRNDRRDVEIESIAAHEERHAMHHSFFSLGERHGELYARGQAAEDVLIKFSQSNRDITDPGQLETKVRREFPAILNRFRLSFLERAKDEIMAFSKDGTVPFEIEYFLTLFEGNYDYPGKKKHSILSRLPEVCFGIGDRLYRQMQSQYKRDVLRMIFITDALLKAAETPDEKNAILGELGSTPPEAWDAVFKERLKKADIISEAREAEIIIEFLTAFSKQFTRYESTDVSWPNIDRLTEKIIPILMSSYHLHDLVALCERGGVFEAIGKTLQHNIEVAGRTDNAHRKRTRENAIIESINDLLDSYPPAVAEAIAKTIRPVIDQIADPVLRARCQRALTLSGQAETAAERPVRSEVSPPREQIAFRADHEPIETQRH